MNNANNDILLFNEFDYSALLECNTRYAQNFIVLNNLFKPDILGIAPEKIINCYDDFESSRFSVFDSKEKALHISCLYTDRAINLEFMFQLISILNQLKEVKFSLYLDESINEQFQIYCNNHINILPIQKGNRLSIETNLIITYGTNVIHFLHEKIPVFVIGPCGLGGFVTPDNLLFLYKSGFMGRPGGTLSEKIPIEMVAHELGLFKDNKEMEVMLEQNKTIAGNFSEKPLSRSLKEQKLLKNTLQSIYSDKIKRGVLKPRLCSNMRVVYDKESVFIKRNYINDTLCNLDKDDVNFFIDLNGKITCEDLRKKHGMIEDELWNIISVLLEKQIIILSI